MRILIDIGHPGHVHLFKNFARYMIEKGHEVLFTCREKEFEVFLLKKYGFEYRSFGRKYRTTFGKFFGLIKFDILETLTALKLKPDVFLSCGSMYAAHASFLTRKPHICFEDTGNLEQIKLYLPFSKIVFVPESFHKNLGKKERRYKGIHELFYLHEKWFKPDNVKLNNIKQEVKSPVAIIRLISWKATHDKNERNENRIDRIYPIIELLERRGYQIIISSESELPKKLAAYKNNFPPDYLHELLYYAQISISEGGTTATEAALLGTPSVLINPQAKHVGSHKLMHGKYQIQYLFDDASDAVTTIHDLVNDPHAKEKHQEKLTKFTDDHIDCTSFLIDYIENNNWKKD